MQTTIALPLPLHSRLAQEPRKWNRALHWVILNNHPLLIQFLLSKGHDISHPKGQFYSGTALHVAASCGHYPLILLVLENPTLDLDKLDIDGNTALHKAIMWCNLKGVKPLHAVGADLEIANKRGKTAATGWDIVVYHIFARFGEVQSREARETSP